MPSKVQVGDSVKLWLTYPQCRIVNNAVVIDVEIDKPSEIFIKASCKYYEYGKNYKYDCYNDDDMTVTRKRKNYDTKKY